MRKVLFCFLLLITFSVTAQDKSLNKNIIYGEFSMKISNQRTVSYQTLTLNYERIAIQKGIVNLYGRFGAGIYMSGGSIAYPADGEFFAGAGIFFGKKSHHLDLQFGAEIYRARHYEYNSTLDNYELAGHRLSADAYGLVGYRYQKPGQAFMLRVGVATYGYAAMMGISF